MKEDLILLKIIRSRKFLRSFEKLIMNFMAFIFAYKYRVQM
jgi:hypothetical protein